MTVMEWNKLFPFYPERRFLLQHINRTAGGTIRKIILDNYGSSNIINRYNEIGKRHQPMYYRIHIITNCMKEMNFKYTARYIRMFTNIRNPFDRFVSIYSRRYIGNNHSIEGFKKFFWERYGSPKWTCSMGPIEHFCLIDGRVPPNLTIIKYEDIQDRWPSILKGIFNIDVDSIPIYNDSVHGDVMSYYDRPMIDKVLKLDSWVIANYYPELKRLSNARA